MGRREPGNIFLTPVLMVKAQKKCTVSSGCHEDTFRALKMSKGNDVFHILSDNDGSSHSSSELFGKSERPGLSVCPTGRFYNTFMSRVTLKSLICINMLSKA